MGISVRLTECENVTHYKLSYPVNIKVPFPGGKMVENVWSYSPLPHISSWLALNEV
jgi:hypothetical protein